MRVKINIKAIKAAPAKSLLQAGQEVGDRGIRKLAHPKP
jgi:hypothetical protein